MVLRSIILLSNTDSRLIHWLLRAMHSIQILRLPAHLSHHFLFWNHSEKLHTVPSCKSYMTITSDTIYPLTLTHTAVSRSSKTFMFSVPVRLEPSYSLAVTMRHVHEKLPTATGGGNDRAHFHLVLYSFQGVFISYKYIQCQMVVQAKRTGS